MTSSPRKKGAEGTLHFVITGGTIDSHYDGTADTARPLKTSCIPSFVRSLKLYEPSAFTQICMKDSRELTQQDLKAVAKAVEASPYTRIIITHGTYTMPDTARYLKTVLKRKDQVVILTGSMIPLTGFCPSDAPFNLGYSIAKVKDLAPGVYLCMNGRIFSPDEVTKILQEGRFFSLFGENK